MLVSRGGGALCGRRRRRRGGFGGGTREHTSFSPTATSKFLPRGITCAISPNATVSLLPLTNLTLNPSITSGLLPVCLNLANSALSDSRIRSIAASKAEKSSASTTGRTLPLVGGPFPPPLFSVAVVWGEDNFSFFLWSGVDEVRARAEGWQWWTGANGDRKGGGRLRRRRRHIEGLMRVISVREVSMVVRA